MDVDPNGGFKKLNFLLQNPPFPVETFSNLLILYTKHGFHDLMADAYDDALEDFMPVLMAQANIYWERGNYTQVEKIFRQTAEFCSEHEAWKLNVAHVFFLQGNKYERPFNTRRCRRKEAQDTVTGYDDRLLSWPTCREEEEESSRDPDKRLFHLCIVNLVIGTLYCSKNNYDFGICRVMKSMEPYHRKLGPDTCTMPSAASSVGAHASEHMTTIRDSTMDDILEFLDCADQHGKDIFTTTEADQKSAGMTGNDAIQHTISYEARVLKRTFLKLRS
ncbi:Tetratricopeptide-like helical domain [Phytophthora cactorum]|nr:Tetratricopeptide-like helical domain [Phytophthora cactorum]